MADFFQTRIFRGQGCGWALQNTPRPQLPERICADHRRELSARWFKNSRDTEHAVGVARTPRLGGHSRVPGVEFRVRRFPPRGPFWSTFGADRDEPLHISGRDRTFRHRGANRDEAVADTSTLWGGGSQIVILKYAALWLTPSSVQDPPGDSLVLLLQGN